MIKEHWESWVFEKAGGSIRYVMRSWWDAIRVTIKALWIALVLVPALLFWVTVAVHGERVQWAWLRAFEVSVWKDLVWVLMMVMMATAFLSVLWMALTGHFSKSQRRALLKVKAEWAQTMVNMAVESDRALPKKLKQERVEHEEKTGIEEGASVLVSSSQEVAKQWLEKASDRKGRVEPFFGVTKP